MQSVKRHSRPQLVCRSSSVSAPLSIAHRLTLYSLPSPGTPPTRIPRSPHPKRVHELVISDAGSSRRTKACLLDQEAIVNAHNFKCYDGQLFFNNLEDTACITPTVIMNGTKIISMQALDLTILDSSYYLLFVLSKMPFAFGLTELRKGYFPHFLQYGTEPELRGTLPTGVILQSRRHYIGGTDGILYLVSTATRGNISFPIAIRLDVM